MSPNSSPRSLCVASWAKSCASLAVLNLNVRPLVSAAVSSSETFGLRPPLAAPVVPTCSLPPPVRSSPISAASMIVTFVASPARLSVTTVWPAPILIVKTVIAPYVATVFETRTRSPTPLRFS